MNCVSSILLSMTVSAVLAVVPAHGEAVAPEELLKLTADELSLTTVHIDYLGPENEKLGPLIFTPVGTAINWDGFAAAGVEVDEYVKRVRDGEPAFRVTVDDLKRFIRVVEDLLKQPSTRSGEPMFKIAFAAGPNGGRYKTFSASIHQNQANDFFILMRGALRADPRDISIMNGGANLEAMRALQSFGCVLGIVSSVVPAKDVSDRVSVTRSGLRFNQSSRQFECTVTLTNTSSAPVKAPISVVLELTANVNAVNPNGTTCATSPVGRPFFTFEMPLPVLPPGQSLEKVIAFSGGDDAGIDFTTRVLAHPGER